MMEDEEWMTSGVWSSHIHGVFALATGGDDRTFSPNAARDSMRNCGEISVCRSTPSPQSIPARRAWRS